MGAFEEWARLVLEDGIEGMKASAEGREWETKFPPLMIPRWEVLESFTYRHDDQDVNHGTYHLKKGQVIRMHDLQPGEWPFMPDRSKLKRL